MLSLVKGIDVVGLYFLEDATKSSSKIHGIMDNLPLKDTVYEILSDWIIQQDNAPKTYIQIHTKGRIGKEESQNLYSSN